MRGQEADAIKRRASTHILETVLQAALRLDLSSDGLGTILKSVVETKGARSVLNGSGFGSVCGD